MFRSSGDVIIRVEAWDEALRFYENVLGFRVSSRLGDIVGFETGALRLYVEKGADHGPVLDFLARDIASAKARMLAAGCTLIEEDARVPRCYLRDPYGITFNIGQAPASA